MLSTSNLDVLSTLQMFKNSQLSVSFVVPTPTGVKKSTLDATSEIRKFLSGNNLHDFASQEQGQESKVFLRTTLISQGKTQETKTSLYRPVTKSGDPRICIYGLNKLANPTDLIAILPANQGLVAINCSQSNLKEILDVNGTTYKNILSTSTSGRSEIAEELFGLLKDIHKKGFIRTLRAGDTGVGFTLETLLGIPENNSQNPDFKGIELKSKRKRPNRDNLFSKKPNWELSRIQSGKELLFARGKYFEERGRVQLRHTLTTKKANSFDLQLMLDNKNEQLHQIYTGSNPPIKDVLWEMPTLVDALRQKHTETFWVTAKTKGDTGAADEEFWYQELRHTGNLDESAFSVLLELGLITVDYTNWEYKPKLHKDKGYLFKLKPKHLDLLFDSVNTYDLAS